MLLTRPFVDKCVGVSRFVKKQMESSFLKQKTTVINNGIDFTPFKEMTPKKRSDIFHIGTVARLDPEKTHHVLIDAFAMLTHRFPEQKFHLTLVGKGSEREKLEKLVTSYGLTKQVTFAGYQNPSYPFYPTFDCFVLPSETEGLALALLEAMAAGCPLICTHPNDEHDAIIDGENGFIAPLHDSRALANALQKLVEDPEMGQRMGHINRQRSHDTFSLEGMSKQYVTLFTDVVAQR
jgi:glycosyltransferase involved in cell wall biosynthesis